MQKHAYPKKKSVIKIKTMMKIKTFDLAKPLAFRTFMLLSSGLNLYPYLCPYL
jgi:hypothetical protein